MFPAAFCLQIHIIISSDNNDNKKFFDNITIPTEFQLKEGEGKMYSVQARYLDSALGLLKRYEQSLPYSQHTWTVKGYACSI